MVRRMLTRLGRFLRQNSVGFIALVVALGGTAYAANTVRSQDIVDGQVKTADLGNGAVTHAKATGFRLYTATAYQQTSDCTPVNIWTACAPITLTVPAGHYYDVTVFSSINGDPGNNTVHALFCPAYTGPTCIANGPDYTTFWPRGTTSASGTGSIVLHPGDWTLSTAIKIGGALLPDTGAHVTTTIEAHDSNFEYSN